MNPPVALTAEELERAAAEVIAAAVASRRTLATAESLTGGMVGQTLCTVPGASAVFQGGVISYASSVKEQVLGVDGELLNERGSVDPQVAEQMAAGAARVCDAQVAVSTTGVAGPQPHDGKPVGCVYLGVFSPRGVRQIERHYTGDRAAIRAQATWDALKLLLEELQG